LFIVEIISLFEFAKGKIFIPRGDYDPRRFFRKALFRVMHGSMEFDAVACSGETQAFTRAPIKAMLGG
jgi:hypothetical protein